MPSTQKIQFGFGSLRNTPHVAEDARELEELGFDIMGMPEHLMSGNPPNSTCLSIPVLAVAAGATQRIRLLSTVVLLPIYQPVTLAKMVADLDIASNGRYIFGVGIGGEFKDEFRAAGIPVNQRGRRGDEILTIARQLWTEKNVTFKGKYYEVDDVTLNPPPLSKPHPALWVGGRRDAAMRRAARFGTGWLPYLYSVERYKDSVTKIKQYAAEDGRDLTDFEWAHHQQIFLADSTEEGYQKAVASFSYSTSRPVDELIKSYYLYGTPKDIIKGLERMVDAGARLINLLTGFSDKDNPLNQARILAKEVLPHFKG
ncbi:MAG: LLM class flavin-dependent oxidoreductase [Chloroflexi bacterium]|nr:LLM class flavin-dependent oxidoreductase [Chloroflexota bacterium]